MGTLGISLIICAIIASFLIPTKKRKKNKFRGRNKGFWDIPKTDFQYRPKKMGSIENNDEHTEEKSENDLVSESYEKTKSTFRKRKKSQLEIVNQSNYMIESLLNKEEISCFYAIQDGIDPDRFYLFVQVSMGEVIKPYTQYGGFVTNNKRFDFVISDKNFRPILVVEYNGTGHYQKNWKERDLVKETACKKAGLNILVITYQDNLLEKSNEIKKILDRWK